ncbi:MAG TPA: DUF4239 domain-containing protein [Candidatus Binatia bacterium]
MLLDFLYALSAPVAALLIVAGMVALSVGGLLLAHRLVPHALRRSHNDVAGVLISLVGVVYAVLLAFIAVAVWQEYNDADAIVHREASFAGDIHQDAVDMRGPAADELRRLVQRYLEIVIHDEWPAMREGRTANHAQSTLDSMQSTLLGYDFRGPLFSDVLSRVNALADARRDRLINANSGLQPVAWFVLLAGAALTILFCYLFGVPDLRLHAVMTALVAASIALVIFLIVAFDYPFRGDAGLEPTAFKAVLDHVRKQEAKLATEPLPQPTPDPELEPAP